MACTRDLFVTWPFHFRSDLARRKIIASLLATNAVALMGQPHQVQRLPFVGSQVPVSRYVITHVYPHDPHAFTQGLEYRDGALFEGTGRNGESTLRKVEIATGRVLQQASIPADYFGEGITTWGQTILQLTWKDEIGFVYDRTTLKQLRTFRYNGEGWGLTHNATHVIMSDGSASLRFLDPRTLTETHRVLITDAGIPVRDLNELEWVNGEIYANVWQTDFVARISPSSGRVLGWIDLSGLLSPAEERGTDVLNGIAYDPARNRLFVTGKLWPKLFEVQVASGSEPKSAR
jgi:glutamine cyclotransferase